MPGRSVDARFAQRMRELMREHGASYRSLAATTYHAKSYLHAIATGAKTPTAELAQRVDDALNAGGELVSYVREEAGDVQRRMMITAIAGLGLGQAADRVAVARLIGSVAERHSAEAQAQAGDHSADDWHEAVLEYGHAYRTAPRAELLADLLADLSDVVALATRTRGRTVARLNEAGAYLASLAAMVCTDLGYTREARHSWRVARRLADAAHSVPARLWVAGQEAVLGPYARRPLPVVLDLVDRGLSAGRAPVSGVAYLYSARAQALALQGRRQEAVASLRDVRLAFEALPDATRTTNGSVFTWPEHRLRHTESFVLTRAGATAEAFRAQDRAAQLFRPTQQVGRSQVELHRAACLVRDGHVADGVRHATDTLAGLPAPERGTFVLTVAEAVLAAVPAGAPARSEVVEYRDLLTASRTGGPGA
jgi:hypothetical protein